jgi:branched-chain amino acid transport system ATP-binding protein
MNAALEVAARAYVMQSGAIAISGSAGELAASDEVRRAYLGM